MQEVATDESKWFYSNGKERLGTFTKEQMVSLIKEGKVSYGSQVWCKGLVAWCSIENTELRRYLEDIAPPPLTGENVNDSIVWILAFAPIIGFFLECVVVYALYGESYQAKQAIANSQFWYITAILNTGLAFWDDIYLKKAGYNSSDKFNFWVLLIPVYLFQRAKALKQNYAYFVVWIICFVLFLGGMATS